MRKMEVLRSDKILVYIVKKRNFTTVNLKTKSSDFRNKDKTLDVTKIANKIIKLN